MPTLSFESEDEISEGKETASPAEMAWIAANYARNSQETQNDSTLSGTFLEEALMELQQPPNSNTLNTQRNSSSRQNFRSPNLSSLIRNENTQNDSTMSESFLDQVLQKANDSIRGSANGSTSSKHTASNSNSLCSTEQRNRSLPSSQKSVLSVRAPSIPESSVEDDSISFDFDANPCQQSAKRERTKGPNELLYMQKHKANVDSIIENLKLRHPGKIRDYREMNDQEKGEAQQMVTSLLSRLRIHSDINDPSSQQSTKTSQPSQQSARAHSTRDCSFGASQLENESPNPSSSSPSNQKNDTHENAHVNDTTMDVSKALLSPEVMDESKALLSPVNLPEDECDSPMAFPADDSSIQQDESKALPTPNDRSGPLFSPVEKRHSEQDIEQGRSYVHYASPDILAKQSESLEGTKKRLASRSAKRGSNTSRLRLSEDDDSPDNMVVKNLSRLSISPVLNFPESQSPILHEQSPLRNSSSHSVASLSFGDTATESPGRFSPSPLPRHRSSKDSLASFPSSTRPPLQNISHNVELKSGAALYYDPLETEMTSAKDSASHPDPLHRYPKKIRSLLRLFYKAISCLLQKDPNSAIVFTLTDSQIIDMTLRLLLRSKTSPSRPPEDHELGGTLIVVRDKEWAEAYGRALREGTSLSVLSHCNLPQKERKSPSNVHRFAKYGVVLTTYDALKSNDVTLHVDKSGKPMAASASQNDWQSSRNGSQRSETVAQFSILHRIHWRRIILVDAVGRKSYLAKSDTSRYKAAKSISSDCRLIFFTDLDPNHSALEMLLRSDRKALPAICDFARMEEPNWNELALEELIVEADDFC